MGKFRKKPVVIEAVQWNPGMRPIDMPDWLWREISSHPENFDETYGTLLIQTLEGLMRANPGDWIIRGVKGELYPCRADIFAATYEPVED